MNDTVTLTREALVDMLTTAACVGQSLTDCPTRGDVTEAIAAYGMTASGNRLGKMIVAAESFVSA